MSEEGLVVDKSLRDEVLGLLREMNVSLILGEEINEDSILQALLCPGERRSKVLEWTVLPLMKSPSENSKSLNLTEFLKSLTVSKPKEFLEGKSDKPLRIWKLLLELRKIVLHPMDESSNANKSDGFFKMIDLNEPDPSLKALLEEIGPSITHIRLDRKSKSKLPSLISKDIHTPAVNVPTLETLKLMQETVKTSIEASKKELCLKEEDHSYVPLDSAIQDWENSLQTLKDIKPIHQDFQAHYDSELKSLVDLCKGDADVYEYSNVLNKKFDAYDFFTELSAMRSFINLSLKFDE